MLALLIDVDVTMPPDDMPLTLRPQATLRTPNGWHLKYEFDGFGYGWVEAPLPNEPAWWAKSRATAHKLIRDAIAGAVPGYDRAAPLYRLNDHDQEWRLHSTLPHDIATLTALVTGGRNVLTSPPSGDVTNQLRRAGYEPGARYTRERCWRSDHVSGGQGRGTCVSVFRDGSGVYCWGQHADANDGPAYISTPALLAKLGLSTGAVAKTNDDPRLAAIKVWAANTPSYEDAINGVFVVMQALDYQTTLEEVRVLVAGLRLAVILREPTPRPLPHRLLAPIVWDKDLERPAQYIVEANRLDSSLHADTRGADLQRQNPALLHWDDEDEDWVPSTAACRAVLHGDSVKANQAGLVRVRCVPVPNVFRHTEWTCEDGAPVKLILSVVATNTTPTEQAAINRLSLLARQIPIPDGMQEDDAAILRLAWFLPVLTETFPGSMPLVLFCGVPGSGKGVTAHAIQRAWRHHYAGDLMAATPAEIDNRLLAGRKGGVWFLDEAGDDKTSALDPRALAHVKSIMTAEWHSIRLFHRQVVSKLRMNHAWFAAVKHAALFGGGSLESDWARRTVLVTFPDQTAASSYVEAVNDFAETFNPFDVAVSFQAIGANVVDKREFVQSYRTQWPDAMPGWLAMLAFGAKFGLTVRRPDEHKLTADRSAVEFFCDWWQSTDAVKYRTPGVLHSFRPLRDYAARGSDKQFAVGHTLFNALLNQCVDKKFKTPAFEDMPSGIVTLYASGPDRKWRWVPDETKPVIPQKPVFEVFDWKMPSMEEAMTKAREKKQNAVAVLERTKKAIERAFAPASESYVVVDFESASDADLKRVGAYRYWLDETTEATCAVLCRRVGGSVNICVWTRGPLAVNGWRELIDDQTQSYLGPEPNVTLIHGTQSLPDWVLDDAPDFVAHNVQFDARAWRRMVRDFGWPDAATWYDTLHASRALLGVGSLEQALQKTLGHGKIDTATNFTRWARMNTARQRQLVSYCVADAVPTLVLAERLLPRLTPDELAASAADFEMNDRGIPIDAELAEGVCRIAELARDVELESVSKYGVTKTQLNSPKQLTAWLTSRGLRVASLDQRLLERLIEGQEPNMVDGVLDWEWSDTADVQAVLDVLKARVSITGIAKGKAEAALALRGPDGRIRDYLQHRAARTGRSSGAGLQPQNLPRPRSRAFTGDVVLRAQELVRRGDYPAVKQFAATLGESVRDVLSVCLRGMLVPPPGHTWLSFDYGQIEARVLAFWAGETGLVEAFRERRDVYVEFGSRWLFGRQIGKGPERDVAKTVVLGCGYRMGRDRLNAQCVIEGINLAAFGLTPGQVTEAYRDAYPAIAGRRTGRSFRPEGAPSDEVSIEIRADGLWQQIEETALNVVRDRTTRGVGKGWVVTFRMEGNDLFVDLPSGRSLLYPGAHVEAVPSRFSGKIKDVVVYSWGGVPVQMYGGKWTENVVQAISYDLMVAGWLGVRDLFDVCLTVHDEINGFVETARADEVGQQVAGRLVGMPTWAKGLPLKVEGAVLPCYLKAVPKNAKTFEAFS